MDLNHFGHKNGNFWHFFFKPHYIKSTFYNPKQLVDGLCQVINLLKKITFSFIKLLIAVDSKFKNDAATSPSGKKYILESYNDIALFFSYYSY